jgi:hypothetical protein
MISYIILMMQMIAFAAINFKNPNKNGSFIKYAITGLYSTPPKDMILNVVK